MVDIKELLRTYVMLNDPNVREITTKFGAVILGLGVATLAVWGVVSLAEDDPASQQPQASTADGEDASGEEDQTPTETECVDASKADAWSQEHKWILLSNRLLDVDERGDQVCFTYET